MSFRSFAFLLGILFAAGLTSRAGVTQVYNPPNLGSNGTADLGSLGNAPKYLYPPATVGVTGLTGVTLTASMSLPGAQFLRMDAGTVPNSTWIHGFATGTKLLWTGANSSGVHASMDLILNRPVYGIGLHLDNNYNGTYTATMAVYDANDKLLGTFSVAGTTGTNISGPFLGALSSDPNIKRVSISTTASAGNPSDMNDFAIDSPIINGATAQQPSITALTNNYSYVLPGLPNYGIAQGSIFVMYGVNMGPSTLVSQAFPLQKTFSGVQINVTVGGTTTQAIPYYVSATLIAAVLASATPTGDGMIAVTYNNQTSAPAPIHVVASAPGVLAVTGNTGLAQATDVQYSLLNYTNSANPKDIVTFWGSGLGAVSTDETKIAAVPTELTNVPLEVYMGGQKATIQWRGRSVYPGLDQINVYVPDGLTGCNVGVFFKVGSMVGNTVSIPVAASGRSCPGNTSVLDGDKLQSLINGGSFNAGFILFDRRTLYPGSTTDAVTAGFGQLDIKQASTYQTYLQQVYFGSCQVHTAGVTYDGREVVPIPTALDAGASMTLSANPGNSIQVSRGLSGFYGGEEPSGSFLFPLNSSTTISATFPGGKDVGAISATTPLGAPLTWTNMNDFATVDRSQPVTFVWSGGSTGKWAIVTGSSYLADWISPSVTTFACLAHAEDGTFTVPAYVLAALPPSPASFPVPSTLSLQYATVPLPFTATGIKLGVIQGTILASKQVTYK